MDVFAFRASQPAPRVVREQQNHFTLGGGKLFGGMPVILAVDEMVASSENVELARFAVS